MDEKGSLKAQLRPQSRTKEKAPILEPKVLIASNEKKKLTFFISQTELFQSLSM